MTGASWSQTWIHQGPRIARPAPFAWFAWLVPYLVHERRRAGTPEPCAFEVRPDATVRVRRA